MYRQPRGGVDICEELISHEALVQKKKTFQLFPAIKRLVIPSDRPSAPFLHEGFSKLYHFSIRLLAGGIA